MPLLIIIGIFIIIGIISNRSQRKTHRYQPDLDSTTPPTTYQKTYYSSRNRPIKRVISRIKIDLPEDLELNDEFVNAFNLIENSNDNIFITGKAGTGKSTLLKYFRTKTKKKVVVVAPTGIAAINVSGQTIHSFFGLPIGLIEKNRIHLRWRSKEMFQNLDTVVIDEVSMARADLIDGIDFCLRMLRNHKDIPFGGIQMVFLGDLFQLPPVVDDGELKKFFDIEHGTEYFFSAKVFNDINPKPKYIELNKIYRQKDQDFINLLNKLRTKEFNDEDIDILNKRVDVKIAAETDHVITLTTTNKEARIINEAELSKIKNKEYQYPAKVLGNFDEKSYPADPLLRLKKGAQVMLIKNDPDKRWVNGTIGEVSGLSDNYVEVMIDGCKCQIPRMIWPKTRYFYDKDKKKIEQEEIGSFEQYPIKLAWAITIHKSQGQTFDRAIIDLGNGAFAHGQVYVALSRCKTFEGISLKRPATYTDIIFDKRIYRFRDKFIKHYLDFQIVACSSCGQKLRFPNEKGQITCPKCKSSFHYNPLISKK